MIKKKENVPSLSTEFKGFIYVTTNTVNGKKYIGKCESNKKSYLGSGSLLKKAIKKYGRQNFIRDILAYGISREDLDDLEKYYIDYYGCQNSDLFYNIKEGGQGGPLPKGTITLKSYKVLELDPILGNVIKKFDSAALASIICEIPYKP